MDVDLSTDLRGLLPLVAPLLSGHSDLAIGTRLAHGSRVVRGPKRELISRALQPHPAHRPARPFSDAQCGFKAVRRDALDGAAGRRRDDGWFFDTELLVLAQRRGLRIHEVPVDWVDDPDSRVHIVRTAIDRPRASRGCWPPAPVARFMGVGVLRTLAYALLYLLLRAAAGRRWRQRGRAGADRGRQHRRQPPLHLRRARPRRARAPSHPRRARVRAHAGADQRRAAVLHGLDSTPARWLELAVLVAGVADATVTRYVALRTWVFARQGRRCSTVAVMDRGRDGAGGAGAAPDLGARRCRCG